MAITVLLYLSKPATRPGEPEPDSSIAGPILVVGAMIAVLVVLVAPLRGKNLRRIEAPTPARRDALVTAAAAAGVGGIALAVLLFVARAEAPPQMPARAVVTAPAPIVEPWKQATTLRTVDLHETCSLDDVIPVLAELPPGFEFAVMTKGEEALSRSQLPPEMFRDLKNVRGVDFQFGRALLVGLEFSTELARRRWMKEEDWIDALHYWHFRVLGESETVVLIRHDGSAAGQAAEGMLESVVQKKLKARKK
jgi:hypothetical protein